MAIIADIVHHGVVYRDIYISPHSINSDSFYTLKYLVGGKNGPPLLGIEMTMRSFTFNNSRAGLSKPDGAGIVYDMGRTILDQAPLRQGGDGIGRNDAVRHQVVGHFWNSVLLQVLRRTTDHSANPPHPDRLH